MCLVSAYTTLHPYTRTENSFARGSACTSINALSPTQRARIVGLLDDADADLLSTLALLQSHAISGGSGGSGVGFLRLWDGPTTFTTSGRVVTIGHVERARLTIAHARSLFTCPPRASQPSGMVEN